MHIPNFHFVAQFGGEIRKEQHFSRPKRVGNPHNSPLINLDCWVLDMLYNFWFPIDWLNKGKNLRFDPSAPPPSNWSTTESWLKFIPTSPLIYIWYAAKLSRLTELERFWSVPSTVNKFNVRGKKWKNKYLTWLKMVFLVFWDPKTDFFYIPPSSTIGR